VTYEPQRYRQCVVQQQFAIKPSATGIAENASTVGEAIDATLTLQRSRLAGEQNLRWLVLAFDQAASPGAPQAR
jgi:hypothetical protein